MPDEQVKAAVRTGITKVNVATELKDAWSRALREYLQAYPEELDPRRIMAPAREAVYQAVRAKIRLLGA